MKTEMKPGDLFNKFQAKKKKLEMKKKSGLRPASAVVKSEQNASHQYYKKAKKNFIQGAIKHPGALHKEMGVPMGKKIPAGKLAATAKKGGKIGRRARLAETLKSFHHKKHKKEEGKKHEMKESKAFERGEEKKKYKRLHKKHKDESKAHERAESKAFEAKEEKGLVKDKRNKRR